MQQRIIALLTVVFLIGAAAVWFWRPEERALLAFFGRGGAILAAAWLAYDNLQRLPGWILIVLPVVLVVLVRWPRLLLALIPALMIWGIVQRILRPPQRRE